MIEFGKQKGKVNGMFLDVNDKGTVFVNVKFILPSGDPVYKKIYITEKSKTFARAQLKKCGMDLDVCDLEDLEAVPNCFDGNEVDLDIYEEEYMGKPQTRVDILTDRPKMEKSVLSGANALLKSAKKPDDDQPGEGRKIIPGFGKQRKEKPSQAEVNQEALAEGSPTGEDVPF